jgi:flagellar biosynthesis/type III secretory pathway protein FliH
MKIGLGRVLPAPPGDGDRTVRPHTPLGARRLGRVEPAVLLEAAERARAVVARAEAEASVLLEAARREAASVKTNAVAEARAELAATFAARELAFAEREQHALERHFDDMIEVARLLAERLLGEALRLEPERVTALARQALTEARGAARVAIVAHPDDAPLLERALHDGKLDGVANVVADATRTRGSLRLETNVGILDAELAPQLDRLAATLRETRGHG